MTDHVKDKLNECADKLNRAFDAYKTKADEYLEKMTIGTPSREDVVRMVREIDELWDCVDVTVQAGQSLNEAQTRDKAKIDDWIETNKDIHGITNEEIAAAALFETSTGRKTAKPQFARRFDA